MVFTKPCVTVSVAWRSRRGRECKSTVFSSHLKKTNTNCPHHNFCNIFFQLFCFFCYFFIVSAMSYAGAHSNFSLLDLRHRAVGPWSTTTTQFLTSIWTVQDGQVAISRCWLPHASHAFVWQREDSLYGALQFWQSATERRYFWWLGRRMKFPRPQMARSASAYWLAIRAQVLN